MAARSAGAIRIDVRRPDATYHVTTIRRSPIAEDARMAAAVGVSPRLYTDARHGACARIVREAAGAKALDLGGRAASVRTVAFAVRHPAGHQDLSHHRDREHREASQER